MELTPARRRALSTALAVILAIESVSAVAAAARVSTDRSTAPAHRPQPTVHVPALAPPAILPRLSPERARADHAADAAAERGLPSAPVVAGPAEPAADAPSADNRGRDKGSKPDRRANDARGDRHDGAGKASRSDSRAKPSRSHGSRRSGDSGPASYAGRNRLWVPSLGINRSIAWFPCSRSREPDNYVYRWGCAGSNNVYLLGHAWGVFEPLHDAYVRGDLRRGMKAIYADANGRVRTYAVRFWKVVRPTSAASWAWDSLPSPSMTLQTCVGARSQYRLMVRLGQVDG
jgi:hypothetical protein